MAMVAFIIVCIVVVHLVAEKLKLIKHDDAPDEERMGCGNVIMSSVLHIAGIALAIFLLSYIVRLFN